MLRTFFIVCCMYVLQVCLRVCVCSGIGRISLKRRALLRFFRQTDVLSYVLSARRARCE